MATVERDGHLMPLMSFDLVASVPIFRLCAALFEDAGLTEQLAVFAQATGVPEGLQYVAEFVSPALERDLIGHVSALYHPPSANFRLWSKRSNLSAMALPVDWGRPEAGRGANDAIDAVDGAHSAASKCHRVVALKQTTLRGAVHGRG